MNQIVVTGELRDKWCKCITRILRAYIDICQRNGLRYFIAYGSAIGAARHHGIIPWDDDIDVVMPRPDFEKFKHICKTQDLGQFELVSPYTTPNYFLPFYKFCDKNTTLIESPEFHCVLGMFIDIFIYDGMVKDKAESDELRRQYIKFWNRFVVASSFYTKDQIWRRIKEGKIKELIHYFLISTRRKSLRKKYLKHLHDIVHKYNYDCHDTIVKYPPGYGEKEVIPKSWIEEETKLPFEGIEVAIPKNYTRWLNHYFGDYTQLPPEEQRHTQHKIFYVNLEKRETYEEVIKKIKNDTQHR